MTSPRIELEPEHTERDDIDDVIGIAAELMRQDEERIDRADLHTVGRELDIPPEYIEKARTELAHRRAEQTRLAAESSAKKKRVAMVVGATAAALVIVFALAYASTVSTLRDRHTAVQSHAAQVANVRARRTTVVQQLADRPASADKDAEIIGAENRIRVETKRYADAAAAYNQAAAGWFGAWAASVAGLPPQVPLDLEAAKE